jgi:hypothetical protein
VLADKELGPLEEVEEERLVSVLGNSPDARDERVPGWTGETSWICKLRG